MSVMKHNCNGSGVPNSIQGKCKKKLNNRAKPKIKPKKKMKRTRKRSLIRHLYQVSLLEAFVSPIRDF